MKNRVWMLLILVLMFSSCDEFFISDDARNFDESFELSNCENENICFGEMANSFPSDGKTIVDFAIAIPLEADENITEVEVQISENGGDFSPLGGTRDITLSFDEKGVARGQFKVSQTSGLHSLEARIEIEGKTIIAKKDFELLEIDFTPQIEFDREFSSWKADNTTIITSRFTADQLDNDGQSLKISLLGPIRFLDSDSQAKEISFLDDKSFVEFEIRTISEFGEARINYKYQNYESTVVTDVLPSFPDDIDIQSNKDSISINDLIQVNMFLDKLGDGSFSNRLRVEAEAYQFDEGNKILFGEFSPPFIYTENNNTGTSNGSFQYITSSTLEWNKSLPLILKVWIDGDEGVIQDSIFLTIK